ncbi:MAG: putative O-glycosylation ligase, exosortase A system-associated [Burkholderiaceae bacterium]
MRDLIIVAIVVVGSLVALRRPWIGVMLWTWLSVMNPHRMSWGFAYDAPLAAAAAGTTLLGLATTSDRSSPFKGAPALWLAAFTVWIFLSWLLGLDPADDYYQWSKVTKVFLMVFVGLALLHSRHHIMALAWISAGSLALLGIKGGLFTILTGGNYRVWGPPDSFIGGNNEFAAALVMAIPLLRFLQLQFQPGWRRHVMTLTMVLCAAAALGSQSRGALLAIGAMAVLLWWRGNSRWLGGVVMLIAGGLLLALMPESWNERMSTIQTYDEDRSALGRISAWWVAWGIAKNYVFGVGFDAARPELFAAYSPYPDMIHAAHSIYFQVLGNHGFVGLFLYLGIFVSTFRIAARLIRDGRMRSETEWCSQLGAMAQVSLVGYAVGGAFLSLSYFDFPYIITMLVVLTRVWLSSRAWEREPARPTQPFRSPKGPASRAQGIP